jgi:DNA-binding NarL/FixJ family response regulator
MKSLTILLAEDHTVVREGLRAFLPTAKDPEVVGEATTGREAVALARKLHPNVVVMDAAHGQGGDLPGTSSAATGRADRAGQRLQRL